ncbi:MAG: helix-turn-helix transcriptional regulator [Chloroflexota bacterium]
MSPKRLAVPPSPAAEAAVARLRSEFGRLIRDARLARLWSTADLGARAGVSRWAIYLAERGDAVSLEVMARVATALGLRMEVDLVDPRRRQLTGRPSDPVHSAMGEHEAAHLRRHGRAMGLDEPYQHYQFAGRADFLAWDVEARALLRIENRTRFPDFQEMAGSFNAKRAYLSRVLADRVGVNSWRSETHVIAALWSAEVLHSLRLRSESFRALCPEEPLGLESWWNGQPVVAGKRSELVVIDPLATARHRPWIGLEESLTARPRHRGYADVARLLARAA